MAGLPRFERPSGKFTLQYALAHQRRFAGLYGFIDCFLAVRVHYACVVAEMLHMQVRETPRATCAGGADDLFAGVCVGINNGRMTPAANTPTGPTMGSAPSLVGSKQRTAQALGAG